jgi:hypothetical protein
MPIEGHKKQKISFFGFGFLEPWNKDSDTFLSYISSATVDKP